jgi:hypothetical protein
MSATVHQLTAHADRASAQGSLGLAVHAYVKNILDAANSLLRDGRLTIIAFKALGHPPAPTIWVLDCPYVRNMARVGIASYDRQGSDEYGTYRIGKFERCGVNVEWIEREAN